MVSGLWGASFSPDGSRLVTASADHTARLWRVRTADVLALADARLKRDFTEAERTRYAELLTDDERGP